jgi:5-methyltetrahydropteroyltriglutamate--homocysteine methyltransferase
MHTSATRILTTHTGSLPRPAGLTLPGTDPAWRATPVDAATLTGAVADIVRCQVEAGIDVVSDGEASKPSYSTYVTDRLTGFEEHESETRELPGAREFPEYFARLAGQLKRAMTNPVCVGPVVYRDHTAVDRDIANLRAALGAGGAVEGFMTAASPGVIAQFMANRYYASHHEYINALADAMKEEYEAIAAAGLVLQLDCPDLASWPVYEARGMSKDEFLSMVSEHIDCLNAATSEIPPEAMRLHVCWGNYEGPHNHDIPLIEIIDRVLQARPAALLFEAANPRHEHEWAIFKEVSVPDGKILVPGVLDTTCNYIEHPDLVAERIERIARLVGMERVIAGTDCGFATFAHAVPVDPRIVWAKLASMVEGAAIATKRLGH